MLREKLARPFGNRLLSAVGILKTLVWILALPVALLVGSASAQTPTSSGTLRIYLDCSSRYCDFDFLRTEIPWVDYVRSPQDADLHVLVTTQGTGGGGTELTLDFRGQRAFAGRTSTARYTVGATDTEDQGRRGLVRVLQASLAPYVVETSAGAGLEIRVDGAAQRAEVDPAPFRDPWNLWVFTVGINGWMNGEDTFRQMNLDTWFSADRVTEEWKFDLGANNRYRESSYELNDSTTVTTIQRNYGVGGLVVRSLGPRLSAGARASVNASTFLNQDLAVRVAPAVEYNLYPYAEATRRELTFQYSLGVNHFDYEEETILGETAETRFDQMLRFSADFTQPWGAVDLDMEGAHFLEDPSQNRLELWGGVNLQVVRGLQFRVGGNAARIRNQIYLPAGELTPEEVLLRQRALATGFRYSGSMGLEYTFGSIYNNVVNPRF